MKLTGEKPQALRHALRKAMQLQVAQAVGHEVVTPSQVTCPRSPAPQLVSAALQLVGVLPEQLTLEPSPQAAVALQRRGGGGNT